MVHHRSFVAFSSLSGLTSRCLRRRTQKRAKGREGITNPRVFPFFRHAAAVFPHVFHPFLKKEAGQFNKNFYFVTRDF